MLDFLSGMVTMGYLVAGLFFLRFRSRTGEGLFGAFAAAFGLLALEQVLLGLQGLPREEQTWLYALRVAAFVLIIISVLRNNRRRL